MTAIKSGFFPVPGANLYYEVRGSGPVLFLIAGGGGGGAGFKAIADMLAGSYTVVFYDRRGAGQSKLDNSDEKVNLETHGEDAHRLLAALTTEPAFVFSSSAGALISLELVAKHPEQVRTVVAHEPPAHYLLPEAEQSQEDPLEAFRRVGAAAALQEYRAKTGVSYDKLELGMVLPQPGAQSAANAEAFFAYTMMAVRNYRLDLPALLVSPTRIIIAGAEAGHDFVGYHGAVAVAEQLGKTVVDFPSHHAGYISHPQSFAEKLREVLNEK